MADQHRQHVTFKRRTDKAILVEDEGGDEHWIPISQIDDDSEIWEDSNVGEEGDLVIPLWLAERCEWV